ncbi:TetR/AcrR family transcriptional regulator [Jeotgalibacillus soli]|uniref:HTH tetR-type domain-containing protein n=1 Tax=Jeotgalibacillus soli TaxID=889306 RepID=A0A0C2RGI8_9BACL|nr:TetR/AcrR family transcriptional regulator [Jeotgalibacillus soli]KIL49305.1 hypothetical protein KP78_07730 [Jeotgalibacillus soli]
MTKNKREDILEAALILFAERGFDGTTVPMIAEKAKVGAGTIYRYFENKEFLVNSLFQTTVQQFSNTLKQDFPYTTTDIREQFRHVFYRMIEFANNHVHALQFIDSHSNTYNLDDKSNQMFEEFLDFFRQLLEDGKKQGIISPLPSDALISIVYGAFSHLFKIIRLGVIEETPSLLEGVEQSCWNAIRVY